MTVNEALEKLANGIENLDNHLKELEKRIELLESADLDSYESYADYLLRTVQKDPSRVSPK